MGSRNHYKAAHRFTLKRSITLSTTSPREISTPLSKPHSQWKFQHHLKQCHPWAWLSSHFPFSHQLRISPHYSTCLTSTNSIMSVPGPSWLSTTRRLCHDYCSRTHSGLNTTSHHFSIPSIPCRCRKRTKGTWVQFEWSYCRRRLVTLKRCLICPVILTPRDKP